MDLNEIISLALAEDAPHGDLTSEVTVPKDKMGHATLVAKSDLVFSGREAFTKTFEQVDPEVRLTWLFKDGSEVLQGQAICNITGRLQSLLKAERVALNFAGHLSGVATLTRSFVQQVDGTSCKILDTRKTTPLFRALEKAAVRHGGGTNHRMNLSDAILIKDNHIKACGSLTKAVESAKARSSRPVEVECATLEEVRQAVNCKAERLLLDNMSLEMMKEALKLIPAGIATEASGNMTLERVRAVAEIGVDFISVGALTHSAPCADLSLKFS